MLNKSINKCDTNTSSLNTTAVNATTAGLGEY